MNGNSQDFLSYASLASWFFFPLWIIVSVKSKGHSQHSTERTLLWKTESKGGSKMWICHCLWDHPITKVVHLGICETLISLLQNVVWQDWSLIFRVLCWTKIIDGRHSAYWFFSPALGKGTFISNRGNGYVKYYNGFLHHWVNSNNNLLLLESTNYGLSLI